MLLLSKPIEKLILATGIAGVLGGTGLMGYAASARHFQKLDARALRVYQLEHSIYQHEKLRKDASMAKSVEYALLLEEPTITQDLAKLHFRDDMSTRGLGLALGSLPFLFLGLYSRSRRVLALEHRVACLRFEHEGPKSLYKSLDPAHWVPEDISADDSHAQPPEIKYPLRLLNKS